MNRQKLLSSGETIRRRSYSKRSFAALMLFGVVLILAAAALILVPAENVLSEDVVAAEPAGDSAAESTGGSNRLKDFLARKKEEDRRKPDKPKTPAASDFVRVVRDVRGLPQKLQTAITRFEIVKDGRQVVVDLIGAIHVGDRAYYKRLNREFDTYDVVLFELVAPKNVKLSEIGNRPRKGGADPISILQRGMQEFLGLEHQLDLIDYDKKHFVHADMSPEEFRRSMKKKGETIWTLMFRMMATGMAKNGSGASDMDLLLALFDPNRTLRLKQVMAEQMLDVEQMNRGLGGENGTTLITGRNKVALKVLREQIAKGKQRIAIFYGCGHMPDFRDRLVREFSMRQTKNTWVTAWDMSGK